MIAGAIAGSATVLLTNPIWVVNTRMTTRKRNKETDESLLPGAKAPKAPTTVGTLLALIREEGPQALFAGVVPALVLVINPILQYTIFEQLKNVLENVGCSWEAVCYQHYIPIYHRQEPHACCWPRWREGEHGSSHEKDHQ
jgi:Mitochondrial carrier protein